MLNNQTIDFQGVSDIVEFLTTKRCIDERTLIVADRNTEKHLHLVFTGAFKLLVFPDDIVADIKFVNHVRAQKGYKTLLAFGAGTINDICKYASYLDSIDFLTCPTAPSVNGYSSSTASIIADGVKGSYKAHLPKRIYIYLDVLVDSPMRLIVSGFNEVLCKLTTQPDWLLSHLLLGTYYTTLPFDWIKLLAQRLFAQSTGLLSRNADTICLLMKILLISGFGMNAAGGSYPWSQGEHQIVHTIELHDKNNEYFHGEKIGVAALTMSKVQNFILQNCLDGYFDTSIETKIKKFYEKSEKHIDILRSKHLNVDLSNWPYVSNEMKKMIINADVLYDALASVGAITTAAGVGWGAIQYTEGCEVACALRNRFTFLDLLPYMSREFDFS